MVHGSLRLGAACCTEARAGGGFWHAGRAGGGGDRVEVGIKDVLSHKKRNEGDLHRHIYIKVLFSCAAQGIMELCFRLWPPSSSAHAKHADTNRSANPLRVCEALCPDPP